MIRVDEIGKRVDAVNELIKVISSCGRKFFSNGEFGAKVERDERGKIWYIDVWSKKRIYTHYKYDWRGFSEGGTLRDLVIAFREFIVHGTKVNDSAFGPWPSWFCNGDLWGYGDDMQKVRDAARRLEII